MIAVTDVEYLGRTSPDDVFEWAAAFCFEGGAFVNSPLLARALVYAPLSEVEFGNVSNSAIQKVLGGLIVSRLVLQSATSATNFEIAVPTSRITARIQLTSTAEKDGGTATIQAVVEYRPYEDDIDGRVRVNSWRVCDNTTCN